MPTIGEALGDLEAALFVGREGHLADFRSWLDSEDSGPSILNVTGPRGVGKTSLPGAFERIARSVGRPVATADGRDLIPLPDSFLAAVGIPGGRAVDTLEPRARGPHARHVRGARGPDAVPAA